MAYVKLDFGKYMRGISQSKGFFRTENHKSAYADDINDTIWEEKIRELFDYLTGLRLPEGVSCKMPGLSRKKAMDVIWFLQEVTKILPDNFSMCDNCGFIKNEDRMFYFDKTGKFYCDECIEDSPVTECEHCGEEVYVSRSWSMKDEMYLCKRCREKMREAHKKSLNGESKNE